MKTSRDAATKRLAVPETEMTDQSKTYVAGECAWNYDMTAAPVGKRLLLLGGGGVLTIGVITSSRDQFFKAWAPFPKRNKALEREMGVKL